MSSERFFCAAESRASGEPIYGTVARIRSWLLLEYPSIWRRNAVEDSCLFSPELKDHIGRLATDRALLIRQDHRRLSSFRCFVVRSCDNTPSATRYIVPNYSDLRNLESGGEPVDDLIFAVCTHGRHDKCCAKFGIPVWHALRALAGNRAWECSHVGGDRFAGNLVVFPFGIYYGRVLPEHVPEILRRSDLGEVWLPGYRGRSCWPRRVQVGEYFVRTESGKLQINEFRPVAIAQVSPETTRITFEAASDGTLHSVEFVTRAQALRQRLTCEATEESPIPQYELRTYTAARRS